MLASSSLLHMRKYSLLPAYITLDVDFESLLPSPSVYLQARILTAAAESCHSVVEISTNTCALAGLCFAEATHIRLGASISPDGSHISRERALASAFNLHLALQFHATRLDRGGSCS